ncbi:ferredoxin [Amycolatopsis balhimycina DSM 5908]|uniref:Ferredoxin n=2 Tax=Amycolatopsis balhimycina TaxID=208443 RepID=A0A428W7B3_AMYBA|nr:ferredoxin [Amycolatopsis balhimycina]RSM38949.1 ferredoxin [Amycolatopsis balhimycina DSM 5908]CBH51376.1 ferredoxin [Amycolatopsis balhimycina DSM 5908]
MQITVDPGRCIGAGQCVLTAPEVFDQNESGIVTVLRPAPAGGDAAAAREAALVCPSSTITVE